MDMENFVTNSWQKINYSFTKRMLINNQVLSFTINGNSMYPNLKKGDRIIVDFAQTDYRFGDIVMIDWGTDFVVHRLICMEPMVTKGDNLQHPDPKGTKVVGYVRSINSFWEKVGVIVSAFEGKVSQKQFIGRNVILKVSERIKQFLWRIDENEKKRNP